MNRPSFQFYPADWLGNSNLRRCSHAEKGVWIDVMCLMHDSEEYGVLRWSLKEIAQAVGCKLADLKSLVLKGVLKGDDKHLNEPLAYVPVSGRKKGPTVILIEAEEGPIWYSSRMVIDEYKRNVRGGFGDAPNHAPKATNGEYIDDTPNPSPSHAGAPRAAVSSSSSSSVKPKTQVSERGSTATTSGRGDDGTPALSSCPAGLEPTVSHRSIALNMHLDLDNELAMFLANARSKSRMSADWNAEFELWLRRSRNFGNGKDQQPKARQGQGSAPSGADGKPWYITGPGIEAKAAELGYVPPKDRPLGEWKFEVFRLAGITEEMHRKAMIDFGGAAA